ncbi:MAG: phosphoribosyltransferase family protein [Coprobacillus sp.]
MSFITENISLAHLISPIPLCEKCLQKFNILDQTVTFHHHQLRVLYQYDDFFKSLLFQYKGLYDYALKDAFLTLYLDELKEKYRTHIIVVAPSSKDDNDIRGFAPMESIASTFSSKVFTGLYKREKYKQSDLSYIERKEVYKKIGIMNGELLTGQKVLIFDDVMTSSSTLLACLSHVESYHPKSIELMVLSSKNGLKDKYC